MPKTSAEKFQVLEIKISLSIDRDFEGVNVLRDIWDGIASDKRRGFVKQPLKIIPTLILFGSFGNSVLSPQTPFGQVWSGMAVMPRFTLSVLILWDGKC